MIFLITKWQLHVRHLVGGRAPFVANNCCTALNSQSAPALMQFLSAMNHDWNISLFHYRNHGADFGRVLVGIQVPAADQPQWLAF